MELNIPFFGIRLSSKNDDDDNLTKKTVIYKEPTDGSKDIVTIGPTGGRFVDLYDGLALPTEEIALIKRYREIAGYTEVDKAISEIVNDAISYDDEEKYPISVSLDDVKNLSEGTKTKVVKEFNHILGLMKFDLDGFDYFRQWYIDGRIFFNLDVDEGKERNGKSSGKKGIKNITHIDSLSIKKFREIEKDSNGIIKKITELFIYIPEYLETDISSVTLGTKNVIRFTPDSIVFLTSGRYCRQSKMVLSYLHKAIKPSNQLAMIEDAIVIYRITRAPERRIFYIDVGNLPKNAAEEYMTKIMNKYRNKTVYNTTTGEIQSQKNVMSMLEDFWLPRREGGKGTEISSLPGGENLGNLEDLIYFRKKLYDSLEVPVSRMESDSMFSFGRSAEISREEVKFSKFINRIRRRFANGVFTPMLKVQCILKNIVSADDWPEVEENIKYVYEDDSHFAELKKLQILNEQVDIINNMGELVKTYFSKNYVRQNILNQTQEEMKELEKDREKEEKEEPDDIEFDNSPNPPQFGGGEEEKGEEKPNPFQKKDDDKEDKEKDDDKEKEDKSKE